MNMSDDLVKALAEVARKEPQEDRRLDAFTQGGGEIPDGVDEDVLDAFRPLDDAARDRIAAAIAKSVSAEPEAVPADGAEDPHVALEAKEEPVSNVADIAVARAKKNGELAPKRSGFARVVSIVAVAVAAAALWMIIPSQKLASVPEYTVDVRGGERVERGATSAVEVPRIGPGSRLEVTLRPATSVAGEIAVRAFLLANGTARAWEPKIEIAEGGGVHVAGTRETLFEGVAPGTYEMVFAVGRKEALPSANEVTSKSVGSAGSAVKLLRYKVLIADARGD